MNGFLSDTNVKSVEEKYVLVKVPENTVLNLQVDWKNDFLIHPVSSITDNTSQKYFAFDKNCFENVLPAERNNLEHLKIILNTLGHYQARYLVSEVNVSTPSELNVKNYADQVVPLLDLNHLEDTCVESEISSLQKAIDELLDTELLVRSVGCLEDNIFIRRGSNDGVFLDTSPGRLLPPVHDALLYIFLFSDEMFRQQHFHLLITTYFDNLIRYLHKLNSNITSKLSRSYIENQIKVFLPVVKFEVAQYFIQSKSPDEKFQELLYNIKMYLKHPLLNQEDVYEIVTNKLTSTHYKLLDYSLKRLEESNGHLGQYFYLKIKVIFCGKEEEFQLFAKFIIVSSKTMEQFMKIGPAKREDFFYRTLLPLYNENGLKTMLDFLPKCYLSRINWLIVMDDMTSKSFTALKPNYTLTHEELKIVVKKIAKFHVSSILLEEILSQKEGRPYNLYDEFKEYFHDRFWNYNEHNPVKVIYDGSKDGIKYLLQLSPELTQKISLPIEEVHKRVDEIHLTIFSKLVKSNTFRNVVNHGDMYVGNVLLKYDTIKSPLDAVLVDFQMMRYCPPVGDLMFFLYVTSDKETRDKYLFQLIEEYYNKIAEYIREFDFDPEELYPKHSFYESIKFIKSAALISALEYCHLILVDFREELFRDQEKFDYYLKKNRRELIDLAWVDDRYRYIVKGLVEELVEMIVTKNY